MFVLFEKKNNESNDFNNYEIKGYALTKEDAKDYTKDNPLRIAKPLPKMLHDDITKQNALAEMKKIIEKKYTTDGDGNILTEIYTCSYDETKLSNSTLKKIMQSDDDATVRLEEMIIEAYWDEEVYIRDEITKTIAEELEKMNITNVNDFIEEYVSDHTLIEYPINEFFEKTYPVIIMLDTGNANYDFSCDNILNYYGEDCTEFDQNSSVKWLAEQFGELENLQNTIKTYAESDETYENITDNAFVKSVMQELENNTCSCSTITFLTTMSLRDLLKLRAAVGQKDSFVTLPKITETGLFDCLHGGGSVLEIEMPADIKIPCDKIYDAWVDGTKMHYYDVDETYGLVSSVWTKSTPVEVHTPNGESV